MEGTTAADLPDIKPHNKVCAPGKGAVIPFMDNSAIYNLELLADIKRLATQKGIKWQNKEFVAGGTDSGRIQTAVGGARVCTISAAVRYLHSANTVLHIPDMDCIASVVREYLNYLGGNV